MKSENKSNSFKESLDVERDHSASMENDWSKLEQRLERYENRHKTLLWPKILGAAAAILLLFFAWWLFQPQEIVQPEQDIAKDKIENKGVAPPQQDQADKGQAAKDYAAKNNNAGNKSAGHVGIPEYAKQRPYMNRGKILPEYHRPAIAMLDSLTAFPSKPAQQIVMVPLDTHKTVAPRALPEKTKVPALNEGRSPKLALSIIYAPALNGVNNFNHAKVGSDVGILLSVGLTKRLSVSTGAIYAKKLYESDFSDYNPVFKPSLSRDPQSVYADCRVLDIPLNINYSLINKGKNSFSIGTGMSSYLMLKEDYRYVYDNNAGNYNNPAYNYSISNKNRHWFGVLNLEAKYQRQINSKFGIGLQPYMKIPINEIGFANVKLQSLGMAVNFNWTISRSSKKDK